LEVGEIPHLQGFTSMPVCASTTANKNAMVACEDQPPRSGLVQHALAVDTVVAFRARELGEVIQQRRGFLSHSQH